MNKFLDLDDLDDARLAAVLARSRDLERNRVGTALRGRTVGLLFMNPSLRTLASMEAGVKQLGGQTFVVSPGQGTWMLETEHGKVMDGAAAEHVREAIPVLAQYADALAVRCFAKGDNLEDDLSDRTIREMAELSSVPFLNLESAIAHPLQALADWKTMDDLEIPRLGGRFVLSWVWHPRALALAVPASTVAMAARRGMHVTVLRPEGFELPASVMAHARSLAATHGGTVDETGDRGEALRGAHVLYAKAWGAPRCYGRAEEEARMRAGLRDWCVDESWFETARPDAKFMHCLPIRRNVKAKDEILDGPRSVVVREAGNRLHVQKSLLVEMLGETRP